MEEKNEFPQFPEKGTKISIENALSKMDFAWSLFENNRIQLTFFWLEGKKKVRKKFWCAFNSIRIDGLSMIYYSGEMMIYINKKTYSHTSRRFDYNFETQKGSLLGETPYRGGGH